MDSNLALTTAAIQIVWLDLMLAGDSAMVLALATRALPEGRRRLGVNLGGILLMVLRAAILFAALACAPLPGFGLFCAAALIFASWLIARRGESGPPVLKSPARNLAPLLLAVVAQDAAAALTNMLAVQAAAQGSRPLAWLGLALALPMLALGAAPFVSLLRKPPLIWVGAILLGWLAGQSAARDAALAFTAMPQEVMRDFAPPTGAVLSLLVVYIYLRREKFQRLPEEE
jgi:predicted tellurium resistance membrane protein TerC